MMIAFDNKIPHSYELEQLLDLNSENNNNLPAPGLAFLQGKGNDRYISVYDDDQLVGFGHLSMNAQADPASLSTEIVVSPNHRNPNLTQMIQKLLHARKYNQNS